MTTRMHAHTDRIRNLEMVGGTFDPDAAGFGPLSEATAGTKSGPWGAGSGQGAYFRTRSPTSGSAVPTYRLPARPGSGRICTRTHITHICAQQRAAPARAYSAQIGGDARFAEANADYAL